MNSLRSRLPTLACYLLIALCAVVTGGQMVQLTRRWITWRERTHAVPRYGDATVVYFYEPTCPACRIAGPAVRALPKRYPRYRFAFVDTSRPEGVVLQEEYTLAYRLPRDLQARIPAAFAGARYFVGADAVADELPAYLRSVPLSALRPPPRPGTAGRTILEDRFRSLGVVPVVVAGLVDSINPCATATLVFFLSYLVWAGRKPRELLWIGGLFTLGVFLTYFAIGLGLLSALHSLAAVPWLGRALYPIAALGTGVLGVVSFLDYRRARRGETGAIALQMPRRVKQHLHRIIRSRMGGRQIAIAAFVTAALVSAVEFTCTSQVYLPTLMYMAQAGTERRRAIALLALYNLMFVLPLILLFTAAALGVSSRRLAGWASRHVSTAKLAMSLLFAGFTVYLCAMTVRMFPLG